MVELSTYFNCKVQLSHLKMFWTASILISLYINHLLNWTRMPGSINPLSPCFWNSARALPFRYASLGSGLTHWQQWRYFYSLQWVFKSSALPPFLKWLVRGFLLLFFFTSLWLMSSTAEAHSWLRPEPSERRGHFLGWPTGNVPSPLQPQFHWVSGVLNALDPCWPTELEEGNHS